MEKMSLQQSKKTHRITKDDLLFLLNQSDFEILQKLNRLDFGFIVFLEKRRYAGNDEVQILEIVIKILSQVCSLKGQQIGARRNRLLRMLKDCQKFLYDDIPRVINTCFSKSLGINLAAFMAHYMNILMTVLCKDFFPCKRIVDEIFPALENYMNRLREKKYRNLESTEASFKDLAMRVENYENPAVSDEEENCEINNFRSLSVVPRSNDIINHEVSHVPHNIVDRPYKSVDHYLSIYYRLTREDMLRSFRECVNKCISTSGSEFSASDKNRYYENVSVISPPEYGTGGICYKIMVHSSIKIDWSKKEVLLPGSLVFLTPNSFNTVIFATVNKNPNVTQGKTKECELKIKLEDDLFIDELTEGTNYTMIEPTAYFECYKHVLSAIKGFNKNNFPLSDVIAYFDFDDPVPTYLDDLQYCLHEQCGSSTEHESTHFCRKFNPLKDDEWPNIDSSELDDQQYMAFKTALTKKVAVIQGPPGTGKTHVGKKIVQALLENTSQKPVIICCLTNHALDQFLEGILKKNITKKIVRMGGQSKSEILAPHVMDNLVYTARQYRQGNTLDKAQLKSLDLIKDFAKIILGDQIRPADNPEEREISFLCDHLNANVILLSSCKDTFLNDDALNNIIDNKYKDNLRNTSGELKKPLVSSILEWLVCCRTSDLYDKCHKKFYDFSKWDVKKPQFQDVWELTETKRFELFYCWRKKCLQILKKTIEEDLNEYINLMRKYEGKAVDPERLEILKGAFVIGVTTTGAAKYKKLLRETKPSIIIIEEAAQVLESHVIASLVPTIQHLILIGDHEQLRPLPADYELSEKYNLKISMFERLFRNAAPSVTLVSQHRMKPCIAELLVPKPYTNYTSSIEVYKYEEIKGVQSSVFFLDHRSLEDSNSSGTSASNDFEARMIASLAKYFSVQDYNLEDMTILAMYSAQVVLIHKYLSEKSLNGIHVTTVDNFQGEENNIILLSFVRSNLTTIGFLKESNRVCVALSRAKKGLFCFGNFELFANKNDLWKDIIEKVNSKNMIGNSLSLKCERHQTIQLAKNEEDILGFLKRGCPEMCNFVLPCEHKCIHTCHFNDLDHLSYHCKQPCERKMDENRVCPRLCYERCKKIKKKQVEMPCGHFGSVVNSMCLKEIQTLLLCEHIATVPCHMDVKKYKCVAVVNKDLECGHSKTIFCHERDEKIQIICLEFRPETGACGHVINVPCYLKLDENDIVPFCNKACGALLDCGHPCVRLCLHCFDSGIHGFCTEKCKITLSCGHKCQGYCNSPCPPCKDKCFLFCVHRTQCINECLRPCVLCEKPCSRVCKHNRCSKKCFEECNVESCMQPCSKVLHCGHQCIGLCGDPCPQLCRSCNSDDLPNGDATSLYVELECEHVIEVNELTEHVKNCLISFEWPSCPKCSQIIIETVRYKDSLMKAKNISIKSCDTTDTISNILYLVDSMYGEDRIVPAQFQPIDKSIKRILKKGNPRSDSLLVLKNCVMLLKKLVNRQKLLQACNESIQTKFETLLLWIFHHLTDASFQQLKELESAVTKLKNSIEQMY